MSRWKSNHISNVAGQNAYLDVQQVRQLLGFLVPLTASCVGDEHNRKQEVVVPVHKFPQSLPSCRDHRTAAEEDAVHIEEDASLMETDR